MNAVAHAIQLVCTGMTFGVLIGSAIQRAKRSKIVLPLEGKLVRLEAERGELQQRIAELEPSKDACEHCDGSGVVLVLIDSAGVKVFQKCPACEWYKQRVPQSALGVAP